MNPKIEWESRIQLLTLTSTKCLRHFTQFAKNSPRMVRHDDEEVKRPFRIQKRRLGTIRFVNPDGEFGFIEAEDFRDDVFFHHSVWLGKGDVDPNVQSKTGNSPRGNQRSGERPIPVQPPQEHMWVEYELDDDYFESEKRLRAKLVRLSSRPQSKKLSGRDAPHLIVKHHPNARKKRPSWRDKDKE